MLIKKTYDKTNTITSVKHTDNGPYNIISVYIIISIGFKNFKRPFFIL